MATGIRVRGTPELRRRMKAITGTFLPVGKKWATGTQKKARSLAPKRTGKGARSIRVRGTSRDRASVGAVYYMAIIDRGSKAHVIVPRRSKQLVFQAGGRTVFSKKVHKPAQRGMGFATVASRDAIRDARMADEMIRLWNSAA